MDGEAIRLVPRGHVFATDEFGKIDIFAYDGDYHNGPICVVCDGAWCQHCDSGWKTELCPEHQEELPGMEFELEDKQELFDESFTIKPLTLDIEVTE